MPENTGYRIVGKKANKRPTTNEPATAPLQPPVEFPKTAAVPPEKKAIWAAGIITTGKWNRTINRTPTKPAEYAHKKPTITAVGANGKTVGTSNAGREFGINFSEIDTNAAVISAKNMRTPVINIDIPAVNMNAWINGNTSQCVFPANSWVTALPALKAEM